MDGKWVGSGPDGEWEGAGVCCCRYMILYDIIIMKSYLAVTVQALMSIFCTTHSLDMSTMHFKY